MKIITDRKWRPFRYRYEVPKRILEREFDWTNEEDHFDGFFQYKNSWYHLSQFMRAPDSLPGWDGYEASSYSTGVVIQLSRDGEEYRVGAYR